MSNFAQLGLFDAIETPEELIPAAYLSAYRGYVASVHEKPIYPGCTVLHRHLPMGFGDVVAVKQRWAGNEPDHVFLVNWHNPPFNTVDSGIYSNREIVTLYKGGNQAWLQILNTR